MNSWRRQPPVLDLTSSPLQLLTAPVSSKYGCERIAPATHQDQAISDAMLSPWRLGRPRRMLVPLRVQWISQTRGCRFAGANPWLAHVAGDPLYCSGEGQRHPIQARGSSSRPLAGLAAAVVTHAKQRVTSKGLRAFKIWKHARASLWASALVATTVFVLAFLRS